jgi:tRNA threonylcarbamoyladenosine biosynthesis protein TsaB
MLILTIRTDNPTAELGLYDNQQKLAYVTWDAHRQLAETIHNKIKELLATKHKNLEDLQGIVTYKGPGSFTGLRIGLSVANALADSLAIPVVAENGSKWISHGQNLLQQGKSERLALPEYGAPPKTTTQRK